MASEPNRNSQIPQGSVFCGAPRRFARAALLGWPALALAISSFSGCNKPVHAPPSQPSPLPETESIAVDLGPQTPTSHQRQIPNLFVEGSKTKFVSSNTLLLSLPVQFSRAELSSRKVDIRVEDKLDVIVFVDQHFVTAPQEGPFSIEDLLWEDVELAPGPHTLTAVGVREKEELAIQSHVFFVEVAPRKDAQPPACVLGTRKTTLNGPGEAKELRFAALPLSREVNRLIYEAHGAGVHSRGEVPPATEAVLPSPPNGDIELSVRCFSGEKELGSDTQIVTVNGDAPEESEL